MLDSNTVPNILHPFTHCVFSERGGGSEEKVSSGIDGTNASFRPMILVVLMGLIYKTYKEINKNI